MKMGTGDLQALAQLISASERKFSKQFTRGYKTLAEKVKNSSTASMNLTDFFEGMELKVNSMEKNFYHRCQTESLPSDGLERKEASGVEKANRPRCGRGGWARREP